MESELCRVVSKPTDYVICNSCHDINWYENKECVNCQEKLIPCENYTVAEWVEDEYEFYADDGWKESDIDNILVEV